MALPGPAGANPQPSRITRASEETVKAAPSGALYVGMADKKRTGSSCRLYDRREVLRIETGTADQGPVDVGLAQQLGCVAGLDRAAVEDPHAVGLRPALAQDVADVGDRLLRLLRGRGATGADRPDRLVGDDDLGD